MAIKWSDEADALAKRAYPTDVVESLVNTTADTYKKLTKTMKLEGDGEYLPVKLYGNEAGQGNYSEDGLLPTGGSQTTKQGKAVPKPFAHVIQFTGLSLKMLSSKRAAFASSLMFQIEEGLKDGAKELNAQAYRDGTNLLAAAADLSGSGTSFTVACDVGSAADGFIPTHFRPGMLVADLTTGNGVVASVTYPSTVNGAATITFESGCDLNSTEDWYRSGEKDKGFQGLPNITGTSTTTMNLAKGTYPTWAGLTIDAGITNLSESMLLKGKGYMKIAKGTKPNCLVSNDSQFRSYMIDTTPQVRFEPGKRDATPDVKYYWNSMEWIVDSDCGLNEVYMFDKNQFLLFENLPFGLDESHGGILRFVDGYDKFVAIAKTYANYGTQNTGSFVRITGLNVPAII
jgi:hypothetical protein